MLRTTISPAGLSAIYEEDVNIAQWQRQLPVPVRQFAFALIAEHASFSRRLALPAGSSAQDIVDELPAVNGELAAQRLAFAQDLSLLCEMYACLFGLEQIGLRINLLRRAMCPRFHVDHVVCRLICTYTGQGTEWLPEDCVDRAVLGAQPSHPDEHRQAGRQQLEEGAVSLLKGEAWPGNAGRGLVHRSPHCADEQPRLIVTMDPIS